MKILKRLLYCVFGLFLVLFAIAVYQESTSESHVVSDIAGGYEVTFSGKPTKTVPGDWAVPYETHYEVKVSSLQSMNVYHMPNEMTDEEIEGELNVASTLGVPQKNVESFEIDGCEGVKFRTGLKHGLAAVINRKHIVSLIAVGYGAEEFIDSFKASQASQ